MEISTVVIGIILFAIATMIIYGWGPVSYTHLDVYKRQAGDWLNRRTSHLI